MSTTIIVISCLLWFWFLGCTFTWKFGRVLLVEGAGLKSIEFVALVLFTIGVCSFIIWEHIGKWILLLELILWLVVQFFCHEYFTIFGVTPRKLKGYNECFKGTVRLFPANETRLVPDFYHIILHLLIAIDLLFVALVIFQQQ